MSFLFLLLCNQGISGTISIQQDWPKVFDVQFEQKGSSIVLQWKAAEESTDVSYEIETSTDGKHFKTAAIVLGGFANGEHYSYAYKVKQASSTKTFYRIKQTNNDGTYRIVSEQLF
jgi:hypothetical protein